MIRYQLTDPQHHARAQWMFRSGPAREPRYMNSEAALHAFPGALIFFLLRPPNASGRCSVRTKKGLTRTH